MQIPRVTVVIPVHDDRERLNACLDALAGQQDAPTHEILVVDNGSTDGPAAVVEGRAQVQLLSEPKRGSYAARNTGLRHARGEILAFTDADCVPRPDWLARGVETLDADPGLDLVAGRIHLFPSRAGRFTIAETFEAVYGFRQEDYVRERHYGATANLFARRRVLERIGPFDDGPKSGGDKEWCQRAHAAGLRIGYSPDTVIGHPMRRTLKELGGKTRRTWRGELDRGAYRVHLGLRAHLFWPYFLKRTVTRPVQRIPRLVRQAAAVPGASAWKLVVACWYRDWVKWGEAARVRRRVRRRATPGKAAA